MPSYYLGADATRYVPFQKLLAISHYIMPNFGTDAVLTPEQIGDEVRHDVHAGCVVGGCADAVADGRRLLGIEADHEA